MSNTVKRLITLAIAAMVLVILLLFTSCQIDFRNKVERTMDKLMSSDSYTITVTDDIGTHTYMVSNGNIYFYWDYDEREITEYLYRNEEENTYYFVEKWEEDEASGVEKLALDKESYSAKYIDTIYEGEIISMVFGYRHVLDMAEEIEGGFKYSYQNSTDLYTYRDIYTIKEEDGGLVITHKHESNKDSNETEIKISNIGKTEIEIPEEILSAQPTAAN